MRQVKIVGVLVRDYDAAIQPQLLGVNPNRSLTRR
jgi:hypothetical protein